MTNSFTISGKTIRNEPAPKVEKWFYQALRRIGGLNDYGEPFLRLVWGQNETITAYGEVRMKYLAASAVVKTGNRVNIETAEFEPILERVDIGRARFFVEEWWPPDLLIKDYDEEVFGKFPQKGKWRHFLTLETPDGKYRPPDRECLQWVEQCWQERQQKRYLHEKGEPEHPFHFKQRMRDAQAAVDEMQERREAELHDRFKSLLAPHVHRLIKPNPNKGQLGHTRRKKNEITQESDSTGVNE